MTRPIRLLAVVAFLLAPCLAHAQVTTQLRLSWDHCAAEGYVADRSFACDTNTGEDVLVLSAVLGDEVPHANLAQFGAYVDFRATSASLPSWWQAASGMCRPNAIIVRGDNLSASPLCTPWYLGDGIVRPTLSVATLEFGHDGPNSSRVNMAVGVPAGSEVTLPGGPQEYLLALVRILHSKSVGTGSCDGCLVPVCIGFGELQWSYPPPAGSPFTILGTTASTVTWQGAYVSGYAPVPGHREGPGYVFYHGNLGCSTGPVPAHGRTWGLIKTLYR